MRRLARAALLAAALLACDRRIEPFDPDEQPREPDLSKIFPRGAEIAAREQSPPELPAPPGGRAPGVQPAGSAEPIRGTIRVADALAERLPDGAVLFIIARRGEAGPPLAVRRVAAPRFPLEFRLGPEDRMIQALPFSGPLQLSARLDSDGNATTRTPGDLQGAAEGSFQPGDSGVELVLSERL